MSVWPRSQADSYAILPNIVFAPLVLYNSVIVSWRNTSSFLKSEIRALAWFDCFNRLIQEIKIGSYCSNLRVSRCWLGPDYSRWPYWKIGKPSALEKHVRTRHAQECLSKHWENWKHQQNKQSILNSLGLHVLTWFVCYTTKLRLHTNGWVWSSLFYTLEVIWWSLEDVTIKP